MLCVIFVPSNKQTNKTKMNKQETINQLNKEITLINEQINNLFGRKKIDRITNIDFSNKLRDLQEIATAKENRILHIQLFE